LTRTFFLRAVYRFNGVKYLTHCKGGLPVRLAFVAYSANQSLTLMLSVTLIRLHKFSIKEDLTGFVIH